MNRLGSYERIVFFTGAGMSAESGVPTYRGKGGIWKHYDYQDVACQKAFEKDPQKVLAFHDMRRKAVLSCYPHAGHRVLASIEKHHPHVIVVTQNIDGMHQRAGTRNVIELHGSLWRLRCRSHGILEDVGETNQYTICPHRRRFINCPFKGNDRHQALQTTSAWVKPESGGSEDGIFLPARVRRLPA